MRAWLEFPGGVHRLLNAITPAIANWTDEENVITAVANKYGKIFLVGVQACVSLLEVS
jgi:hypothetical protein